ncbi:MAG: hypothetical protein HQL27_03725 [Candidatus Omnitrophica bacterium]|nr:hypothetical protein [Candidatus Omnitrophota bacterium]
MLKGITVFTGKIKPVIFMFFLCIVYWVYLIFNTEMPVVFDSLDYEALGKMIANEGWVQYFKTGPNREPLYPFLISISVRLAAIFKAGSYQPILKMIQISFLFVTQILLLTILRRLKVRETIILATVLYFGFSPSLLNASLSLFSEIASFPFALCLILSLNFAWKAAQGRGYAKVISAAILTALFFLAASFGKAIFIYVFYSIIFVFILRFLYSIKDRDYAIAKKTIVFTITAFVLFQLTLVSYKLMNKKYNGYYEFTSRSYELLFGNSSKRVKPETLSKILPHLAIIPGQGFCQKFFSQEDCWYADFQKVDAIRGVELAVPLAGVDPFEAPKRTLSLALEKVFSNPGQYILFTFLENFKMPFWESTQIGFVTYPSWLDKIYKKAIFKDLLRLIVSTLTIISFFHLFFYLARNLGRLFNPSERDEVLSCKFFIFFIILAFTALYSLFSIITRYALPIASLYLITIAIFIERRLSK